MEVSIRKHFKSTSNSIILLLHSDRCHYGQRGQSRKYCRRYSQGDFEGRKRRHIGAHIATGGSMDPIPAPGHLFLGHGETGSENGPEQRRLTGTIKRQINFARRASISGANCFRRSTLEYSLASFGFTSPNFTILINCFSFLSSSRV